MKETLPSYVLNHTERGECSCGSCFDRGNNPDPTGHVADTTFFKVAAKDSPCKGTFLDLCKSHRGEFNEVNPLDGQEHSFIELGWWLGDRGIALRFMGLGALLGVFKLLTPETLIPMMPSDLKMQMAQSGLVIIKA